VNGGELIEAVETLLERYETTLREDYSLAAKRASSKPKSSRPNPGERRLGARE
jgi:hypothetical protein